jgi:hypothetical protein
MKRGIIICVRARKVWSEEIVKSEARNYWAAFNAG